MQLIHSRLRYRTSDVGQEKLAKSKMDLNDLQMLTGLFPQFSESDLRARPAIPAVYHWAM